MKTGLFILPFLSVIIGAVSAAVGSAFPEVPWISEVGLLLALTPLVAWVVFDLENFRELFKRRGAKYGASSGVNIILGICLVVGVAFVSSRPRFNKSWDTTRAGLNTLSDQSKKVLAKIEGSNVDVKVTVFTLDEAVDTSVRELMALYQPLAPTIRVDYIDPRIDPSRAMAAKVSTSNTVIVESGQREARITTFNEEKLTNALIQVLKDKTKKIYFTTGHGEGTMKGEGAEEYGRLSEELEHNRYALEELKLIESSGIPADADLLVIAGPKYDLTSRELEMVEAYLHKGGAVMALIDAVVDVPNLNKSFSKYGLKLNNDLLILRPDDPRAQLMGQNTTIVQDFDKLNPATRDYASKGDIALTMMNARSVSVVEDGEKSYESKAVAMTSPIIIRVKGVTTSRDLETIDESRIEGGPFGVIAVSMKSLEKRPKVAIKEGAEQPARDVESGVGVETQKVESRLILVGSSQLATNVGAQRAENKDMALNLFSYLLRDEDFISIRPKDLSKSTLELSTGSSQLLLFLLSFLYPLGFAGFGAYYWFRRRNA
jgi:hypothetical protein